MQGSDGNCGGVGGTSASLSVDRRSYLKLAGVAAGSVPMLSGAASAAFTRRGIRFERSVDMVADAGCDPSGNEPCDAQIQDAADSFTLLRFPPGEYKITEKNVILDETNIGFLGEGDVRFVVPEQFNEKALVVDDGTGVLFENIDIDLRADGATPGLHFGTDDDLEIHDVEYIGQGIHPDSDPRGGGNGNPDVTYALYPIIRSPDGTGTVSNVVAKNAGLMGAYNNGDGRVGVWIGITHKGTVTLENCQFEGFPNNGLYCSRTGGAVQVEGGVFRNNDITQVRLSSRDSYVKDAVIGADLDNSDSPNPEDTLNSRGVRFEAGRFGYGGAYAENCDISILSTPNSGGGIVVGSDGADHSVRNTRIRVEDDATRGFYAKAPTGYGSRDPPPEPHDAELRGVSVTGGARDASAIRIDQRDDSVVSGCCIDQSSADRNGVVVDDSNGVVVTNSTIDVAGQQVVEDNSSVQVSDIDASGSCPVPNKDTGDHVLTIEGAGSRADYTFTVESDLAKSTANGADRNSDDTISGQTATGYTSSGLDSYTFAGDLVAFDLDGEATVTLDGEPAHVGQRPDHVLTIEGTGSRAEYEFTVGDNLAKSTANGADRNGADTISGRTVTGYTTSGLDSYTFSGELERFLLDGEANVTLDGEPAQVGQRPDHVLTIEGTGSRAEYEFTVDDNLEKSTANGADRNSDDTIAGQTATGYTTSGLDSYTFSGEIESFTLDGEATVTLDGEPANVGQRPDHVLTIEGTGSRADYEFTVSDDLAKSTANGADRNSDDTIAGQTATGYTTSGLDSYTFSGEIESFSLDGEATVTLDGEPANVGQRPDHVLSIEGTGSRADYEFTVEDNLEKSTAGGADRNSDDTIAGQTATGYTTSGLDSYTFSGELVAFDLDGEATVTLDGEPANVGQRPGNVLSIRSTEGTDRAEYEFTVGSNLAKSTANGADRNSADTITGQTATGYITSGLDSYAFSGDIEQFDLDGSAGIFLNGNQIDPNQY